MPTLRLVTLLLAGAFAGAVPAQPATPAPAGDDATTGRMLYTAQCSGCHRAQVHWRDQKIAVDWATLVREVRRWQQNSGLAWGEEEVLAVARYLNATWYHFPSGTGKELARRAILGVRDRGATDAGAASANMAPAPTRLPARIVAEPAG